MSIGGIYAAGPVTKLLEEDSDPESLLRRVMSDFELEILEKSSIEYKCYCSRERMEKALISLGPEELKAVIDEQGDVTLSCQFCDNDQLFTKAQLEEMLANMGKKG